MLLPLGIVDYCYIYRLVDVHDIETGLSTQFWDLSAKNKLQIYNPMCFYAVCYSLARNISWICWVHVYSM
jgi:hypothetical protein